MDDHQQPPKLTIRLLGAPEIRLADRQITGLPAKTQALLFYLAMTPTPHLRTVLANLLWGGLSEHSARSNLRKAIQQLRTTLPDHFRADRRAAALHGDDRIWVDTKAFEEQIAHAIQTNDLQALDTATQHYGDDFLTGFFVHHAPDFEAWQLAQRDRLRERLVHSLHILSQQYAAQHALERAIAITRRLLELEPWREEAHRHLMRLLATNGQRDAALVHYERCRQALETELAVGPGAETTTLYEQIRADHMPGIESRPPAISIGQRRHNLPTPTTPLLGRAAEIAQILQIFEDPRRRLVSLVSPGGMGKTHLAIAVATQMRPQIADGVYFVALAPLIKPDTMVPTIAASVGYSFRNDGRSPKEQLLDYLRPKALLLLLDNAEHLLAGVALFTEILQTAPEVRLLVTTRERLRLSSETIFALDGLAVAQGADEQPAAAEQLFIQTAQRVRPTFEPAAVDWPAIHQICRLVGGMPLGLILAAARIELLSPLEIVTEIRRSLDFLAADLRDMPARHHSLRAVFESTWHALSAADQKIFSKLAIFSGGFTREAATAVADASLASLTALHHRALIQYLPNRRYEIHELLRQFAQEKLAEDRADYLRCSRRPLLCILTATGD